MTKILYILILISTMSYADESAELKKVFTKNTIDGVFVLKRLNEVKLIVSDSNKARIAYIPASTFKIPNTLIAVDGSYVKTTDTINWDGKIRDVPQWNANQTIESAFKVSCVWAYESIEKKIGVKKYETELKRLNYGNAPVGIIDTSFWISGELRISAEEQVMFLERLINRQLGLKNEDIIIQVH